MIGLQKIHWTQQERKNQLTITYSEERYSGRLRKFSEIINMIFSQVCKRIVSLFSMHYANMPVQYAAIFHGFKNDNFQMKNCDIFLIFAQNIDRGHTLEPPQ